VKFEKDSRERSFTFPTAGDPTVVNYKFPLKDLKFSEDAGYIFNDLEPQSLGECSSGFARRSAWPSGLNTVQLIHSVFSTPRPAWPGGRAGVRT